MVLRVSDAEIEAHGTIRDFAKDLIEKVTNGTMEIKERAAYVLQSLATQSVQYQKSIQALNVIQPLVALLTFGSPVAQERAAGALASLMRGSRDYQQSVLDAGALTPLATILRSGGGDAQEQAAAACASLSELPESHATMLKANCIGTLIELLRRGSSATPRG